MTNEIKKKSESIRFITSAYGNKYVGFLLNTIYSISESNRDATISVLWEDIDEKYIDIIKRAFPLIEFVRTDFDIQGDPFKRISSKTLFWEKAVIDHPGENLCLIDSDVLVIKDIAHFFAEEFDLGYTYKDGIFPLNSGVMLVKNKKIAVKEFFKKWREETAVILDSKELSATANSLANPYGGGDQMSFYRMIDYQRGKDVYKINFSDEELMFKGFPCRLLNETESKPITEEAHIIHYKGGWRMILAEGGSFTRNRNKKNSFQPYLLFLKSYLAAIERLKTFDPMISRESLFIKIPSYLELPDLRFNRFKYIFFVVSNWGGRALKIFGKFVG